ncbi:helix-turn-helix transcriptional regulator [Limnohabitans sp.]|uniref:helix-turn-helix domain-containing protein n=1 Tax=Limnohabitans sp. TaxID=1907725 RepID=UPI00286EE87A|nr:helix-turn-helix transcriptional regulator [Limnohabitans sp.]
MGKPINGKLRTGFGERVKTARLHAKLTQQALAKLLGTAQSTIAEMEWTAESSGYTAQISDICKVSASWLATGKGAMSPNQERSPSYAREDSMRYENEMTVAQAIETIRLALLTVDTLTRAQAKPIIDALFANPEQGQDLGTRMAKTLEGHTSNATKKRAA